MTPLNFHPLRAPKCASAALFVLAWLATSCGDADMTLTGNHPRVAQTQEFYDQLQAARNPPGRVLYSDNPVRLRNGLRIGIAPAQAVYRTQSSVRLDAQYFDAAGTAQPAVNLQWSAQPPGAAQPQGEGNWSLLAQGPVTFSACADAGTTRLCSSHTLVVDDGPPQIALDQPLPGQELQGPLPGAITVTGRILDHAPNVTASVNGMPLTLDPEGQFRIDVPASFGINSLHVTASDGLHREPARQRLDVLWAPHYLALPTAAPNPGYRVDGALKLRLGQNFLDDGTPATTVPEQRIITSDLADLAGLVLSRLDLNAQIRNPIVPSGPLTLALHDVRLNEPQVSIAWSAQGLELFIHLPRVQARTSGQLALSGTTVDLGAQLEMACSAVATLAIRRSAPQSRFEVRVQHAALAIESARGTFNSPEASAFFDLAQGAVRTGMEDTLMATLRASMMEAVAQTLADALNGVSAAMATQSLPIGLGTSTDLAMTLRTSIETFDIAPRRSLASTMSVEVATNAASQFGSSRGVALTEADPPDMPLFESSRIQLGIRLGLINAILHALWNSGLLEMDVREMLPEGLNNLVRTATVSGRLPPVIAPSAVKSPQWPLTLTTGQLELTLSLGSNARDIYGMRVDIGLNVALEDNHLRFELAPTPEVEVWVVATDSARPRLTPDQLQQLVLQRVWPELRHNISQGLSTPIPLPQTESLAALAPSMAAFALQLRPARPLDVRGGAIVMDLSFEGWLPLR